MGIVARARRLGWPVEQFSDGYKIKRPNGKTAVQVHLSPSDVNHYKSVLRKLNECGFEDAERALLEKRLEETQALNDHLRKEADAKATRIARNSKAVVRAAGDYMTSAEPPDPEWVLSKSHPAPWPRYMLITPDLAETLLKDRNTGNRPIYKANVRAFRGLMSEGKWRFTHQGVAIDRDGRLQDGQHRLQSIVDSGEPQALLVFVGMDPENFTDIDNGKVRTLGDILSRTTEGDLSRKAALVRLIHLYTHVGLSYNSKLDAREAFEIWEAEPDRLQYALNWGSRISANTKARINYGSAAAAAYLLFKLHGDESPLVEQFLLGLQYRPGDLSGDPRVLLHRYMEEAGEKGKKLRNYAQLALITDTWNMIADDVVITRRTHLRWTKDRKLPRFTQIGPGSATPRFLVPSQQHFAPAA